MASNQEMMDRISQLTTAIQQQRNNTAQGYSYRPNYRPNYRPSYQSNYRPPTSYRPSTYHTTYQPNYPYSYRPVAPTASYPNYSTPKYPASKSHHRQLINEKNSTIIKSVDSTGRQQVSVNGVAFVVKGKKLVRKDVMDKGVPLSTKAPKYLIRKRMKSKGIQPGGNKVFVRGPEGYIRHGQKSLVLKGQVERKKPRYCGFYTRYGSCPKRERCTFRHDPARRAICPKFLQGKCKATQCRLSHTPSDPIMPHCGYFQKGACTNDPCLYAHVRTNPQAPVCKPFATEGFCAKGKKCQEKHVHVCPEFAEIGKCSNANCRLPHVARRKSEKGSGIVRLSSWVSPGYLHEQKIKAKMAQEAVQEAVSSKTWVRPSTQKQTTEEQRNEKLDDKEDDAFVRLFDEEEDGWAQYEREGTEESLDFLRFKDEDEEDGDEEDEEENETDEEVGSDMEEIYEEVSEEGDMSSCEE
ncbi:hypothetical protein BY458DRAFT_528420 [Sporodiniella umbellata]|nr:hypothetical protein BY458DRAFT_528420 [Sporodiniella umbellata]